MILKISIATGTAIGYSTFS